MDAIVTRASEDGMHVKVSSGGKAGIFDDIYDQPIGWLCAESEGDLFFITQTTGSRCSIPLEVLERVIAIAREKVHSENFYPYPENGS